LDQGSGPPVLQGRGQYYFNLIPDLRSYSLNKYLFNAFDTSIKALTQIRDQFRLRKVGYDALVLQPEIVPINLIV
jgi:hypothetical protein